MKVALLLPKIDIINLLHHSVFYRSFTWMLTNVPFSIPRKRLYETPSLLAFFHPKPSHAFHVVLLPRKSVRSLAEMETSDPFLGDLVTCVQSLVREYKLPAYRLIVNGGEYQEFPHLHFHLISDVDIQGLRQENKNNMQPSLAILDFGSQYAQLIARRVREAHVYCELFPCDAPAESVLAIQPRGFILSGGPASAYAPDAPSLPGYVLDSGLPVLGICYGMQLLAEALGGEVSPSGEREYGPAEIELLERDTPLEGITSVWMSHGDRITRLPPGFTLLARSGSSPIAAMGDLSRRLFAVQFHPEVRHTPGGDALMRRFAVETCGCDPTWTPASIIEASIDAIRQQVGNERVLAAVSGGVDSSVAAALVHRAVGDQLAAIFVDTGLLRQGEPAQVVETFGGQMGTDFIAVDASTEFMEALKGITEPEQKRRIVGEKFIRIFERQAEKIGSARFLVQGTIYPDLIESAAPERNKAARIKSHHNGGGLPERMALSLVEPLRYLFKDEVRLVGEALRLPEAMVWRQPFPGPGLAVRCLGEVTPERVARLQAADAIFLQELGGAGLLGKPNQPGEPQKERTSQAFAVLLPVRSVGVMGDERTYHEVCALRAVVSDDFMTADWARLPADLLARAASRIVNEVQGINRVVYDITSKPPATIEWE